MIEIDGAEKSGSGTLVRFAVALCSLTSQPMRMVRIREKREKQGLRPQHLLAVKACAQLSSGRLEGAEVGSKEIAYYPGRNNKRRCFGMEYRNSRFGHYDGIYPDSTRSFCGEQDSFTIRGGLFQDNAPTAFHMEKVLAPLLGQMGAKVS